MEEGQRECVLIEGEFETHKQIKRPTYASSGANKNPRAPAIVGTMKMALTSVRLFGGMYLFARAPRAIQIATSTPCGMPNSAVCSVSKPRPLMTRVEKLEIPPLGTFETNPNKVNNHVL